MNNMNIYTTVRAALSSQTDWVIASVLQLEN